MVFAMGTVAFAVEDGKITKADPDAESFIVKTVVDPEQDYESWEVTIPADIEIPWGDTAAQSSEYTVNAQLKAGASLTITAAGSGKLGDTIPYTLAGDINVTTGAVETNLTKAITAQVVTLLAMQLMSIRIPLLLPLRITLPDFWQSVNLPGYTVPGQGITGQFFSLPNLFER